MQIQLETRLLLIWLESSLVAPPLLSEYPGCGGTGRLAMPGIEVAQMVQL